MAKVMNIGGIDYEVEVKKVDGKLAIVPIKSVGVNNADAEMVQICFKARKSIARALDTAKKKHAPDITKAEFSEKVMLKGLEALGYLFNQLEEEQVC